MSPSKNKNPLLLPGALIIYAIVMGIIAYPRYEQSGNWKEFWGILGVCVAAAILLYFLIRRRNKTRDKFNKS